MVANNDFFWSSATFLARQVIANSQSRPDGMVANSSVVGASRSQGDPNGAPAAVIQIMGDIPGRVNLQNIGVSAAHRGKGLGRHLLERSIYVLRGWGISRMGLEVTESNKPALALYRSLGFEVVERLAKPFVPRTPVKVKFEPGSPLETTIGSFGSVLVRSETGADASDSRSHSPNPRS
jgi:ribosomal protein S18 acetylase RimI-like enzyme